MSLKILVSGHLVRYPLGGFCWHHLQYLVGLRRLGHDIVFFEDFGWPDSCYDPSRDVTSSDATYGVSFLTSLMDQHGLSERWCYLAEDGRAHGMTRDALGQFCRECDLYINLSNLNWIDELTDCRRRVLVDTDPVFTQIGALGMGGELSNYHVLFTYGENVHKSDCTMPTAEREWRATRQPVVLDLWPTEPAHEGAPFTTVTNWSAYGDHTYNGQVYGQKDREFEKFIDLPRRTKQNLMLALSGPDDVKRRLRAAGWGLINPLEVSREPEGYKRFIRQSRGEWCVAKHGYVATQTGWFSDRSAAYLASGRPVVLEDTGFSRVLPCGSGLFAFTSIEQAARALDGIAADYATHSRAARQLAVEYFDSTRVLTNLLEQSL